MVDIHCHLLPGFDDGSNSGEVTLGMAKLALSDGIGTIIATPHQLGKFAHNKGDAIRQATRELQVDLDQHGIPLRVLPGADVRIDSDLTKLICDGQVLTLADRGKHVLLELPHELYVPLEPLMRSLDAVGMTGILSHPERNRGLLSQREFVPRLVDAGCLMQITAGSLTGAFGASCREFCQWMLRQGLVHFVATDAHGMRARCPLLRGAYDLVCELTDETTARDLCVAFPRAVADGAEVPAGRRKVAARGFAWFSWKKAG
jgi:protein-tyrosine phosphatase